MTGTIAAELAVAQPASCPVALATEETDEAASGVRRAAADEDGRVVEEFELPAEREASPAECEPVAEVGAREVFRFEREPEGDCVCEVVESLAGPVADVRAEDGTLYVSVYAEDVETVRDVVGALEGHAAEVRVRELTRADAEGGSDPVIVDRDRLTARQREVLETAHELGYFEHPKGANGGEVAEALEISPSTFREHLAAAQGKLLDAILAA